MLLRRPRDLIRVVGGWVAAFSLIMGLIVYFVLPIRCTFVGSLQLLILGFLFLVGVVLFITGQALVWRNGNGRSRGMAPAG